jgi:hypothetical protein
METKIELLKERVLSHVAFSNKIEPLKEWSAAPSVTFKDDVHILVDLYHLPKPTTTLIGRKAELAQLTEAFTNPNKRLAIIVAAGGIGKSALTDEWLQQIAQENYYGKTRVFGWSFYSQGSHNTFTNVSAVFATTAVFADSRWFRAVAIC